MAGLNETLRLVVDMDTRGAVKGLEQVGKTADRELGKTDDRLGKVGRNMQKVGVGMVASGALLVGGLYKAAKASEEAEASTRKLSNSVENNANLAGHSVKEFTDLAAAIQRKTAADADDITAGVAVLAQGKLNAQQIKELTPLVVDLARKKGIDEVTAFTLASKAAGGNAGALKKQGIAVDENLAKTDAYKATVEALRGSVGGFAEEEGKTFSGSMERLKNQMGDIEEGVGKGAVDAFSSLLKPVGELSAKFAEMDPQVQSTIGKFATFGATGLIAGGSVATVVGKVLTLNKTLEGSRFALTQATGGLTGLGKAMTGIGVIGTIAGIAAVGHSMTGLKYDVDSLAASFSDAGTASEKQLQLMYTVIQASGKLDSVTKDLAGSNVAAAHRFVEYAEAQGLSADKVEHLNGIIDKQSKANAQASVDAKNNAAATEEQADALSGDLTPALGDATEATKTYSEQLADLNDATLAQFDSQIAYARSLDGTEDALGKVSDLMLTGKTKTEEYQRAVLDAKDAVLQQAAAAAQQAEDQAKANGQTLDASEKNKIMVGELVKVRDTLKPGSPLYQALSGYIYQLGLVPAQVDTNISAKGLGSTIQGLQTLINQINSVGDVQVHVTAGKLKQLGYATGGPVYAANGMFTPRGTDTVPAMLTPGEYVVNKKAVDTLGVGAMHAINQGRLPSGGGGADSLTVVLQLDKQTLGVATVDGLRTYNRNNGPIPIKIR